MGHHLMSDLRFSCHIISRLNDVVVPVVSSVRPKVHSTSNSRILILCRKCHSISSSVQALTKGLGYRLQSLRTNTHRCDRFHPLRSIAERCTSFSTTSVIGRGDTESAMSNSESERCAQNPRESDSFVHKIQQCTSYNDVLNLAETAVHEGSLLSSEISFFFTSYQKCVYSTFSFPWLLSEQHCKRMQFKANFVDFHTYTTDPKLTTLMSYTERHALELPINACLQILCSLDYLFVPKSNTLVQTLYDICCDSVESMDLCQLAKLSSCLQSSPREFVTLGRIANAAKIWLTTHSPQDVDLDDLCELFGNIKDYVSRDMFELGAQIVIASLEHDITSVTLPLLSKVSLFAKISGNECRESLLNGISHLQCKSFKHINITNSDLTFDVCSSVRGDRLLCPVSNAVRAHCAAELQSADCAKDLVRFMLPLEKIPKNISENRERTIIRCVQEADNFLLFHLMRHHLRTDMIQLPRSRELFYVYHLKLVKLVTELNSDQLEELLWNKDDRVASLVFKLLKRMSTLGIHLNEDLVQTLDGQLQLKSNEWDVPTEKIVLIASDVIEKSKANVLLTANDLQTLVKFFHRLDFDDLMSLYKKACGIYLLKSTSLAARQQAQQLRSKLKEVFEEKLSHTDILPPSLTYKSILPLAVRSKSPLHSTVQGLFSNLMDSLPRFVGSGEEKNCLRALKILDLSVEKNPTYQGDTYEQLVNFVISSPHLLVFPGLQLLKTLACCGYQPNNLEEFTAWTLRLANQVMQMESLDRSIQVHLAYYMSLMGIFHDELLSNIFSLEFMMALDTEMDDATSEGPDKVKRILALLNRSVAIECPHLAVPWFGKTLLPPDRGSEHPRYLNKVIDGVCRVCGGCEFLERSTHSPYSHSIDALLCFDSRRRLIRLEDTHRRHQLFDCEKVAILYLGKGDICAGSDLLNGQCQADVRQLQMLGYTVVVLLHHQLSSMEFYSEESLDDHLRKKINSTVGFQLLVDPAVAFMNENDLV